MAYKLDNIDRRLLFELDSNCRLPDSRLARLVGKSNESVRYRIKRMRAEGYIRGFGAYIDATALGLQTHKLYLRTREKPQLMRAFLAELRSRPDVLWIGKGDGAWNVGLTFCIKDELDFFYCKNELFSRFRELVVQEVVGTVMEAHAFGKKFLLPAPVSRPPFWRVMGPRGGQALDAADSQILRCLIDDGRIPYTAIAARTGLSAESVRARAKALSRRGIIARSSALLDSQKLGYEYYKTFLYFDGLARADEKRLFETACRHPNVVAYLKVLAPWDIELEIMAQNYHEYNEIINYFRQRFSSQLTKVETTVQEHDELLPARKLPQA